MLCLDAQQQPRRLDASAGQYNQRSANNRRLIAGPHLDSGNFAAPGVEMRPRGGASEADPQVGRCLELCPVTFPHIRLSGKAHDAAAAKSYVNSPRYRGNKDQQYRERNYSVFFRGGMGINYGHEKWWPFGAVGIFDGGAGWLEALGDLPIMQAKYAWNLIDKYITDTTWKCDDGKFVTAGIGEGEIKAASGFSEVAAVAHFPSARPVTVNTTAIAGPGEVKLSWYDPTTGTYTTISESERS